MTVDLDEGVTNAQAVINAVESAGYGASEIGDKENKLHHLLRRLRTKVKRRRNAYG